MFNLFKTKGRLKTVQNIVQLFYAALFDLLDMDKGKLPDKLKDDFFIIAYIYGVIGFVSIVSHIDNERQKGLLIYDVFEKLFPDYGKEITEKCNQLVTNDDKQFLSIFNKAISEIEMVYKNNGNGSLPSLIGYVREKYED